MVVFNKMFQNFTEILASPYINQQCIIEMDMAGIDIWKLLETSALWASCHFRATGIFPKGWENGKKNATDEDAINTF